MVVAAAMKTAAATVQARMTAMAAMALVTITLVTLVIAHFVTHNVINNAISCFAAVTIAFVCVQQRGW